MLPIWFCLDCINSIAKQWPTSFRFFDGFLSLFREIDVLKQKGNEGTAGFAVTEDVKFQDNSKVDLCYIFYGFMLRIGVECRHICDKLRMQAKKKLDRVRGSLTFYSKYDKNSYHIHRIVSEIERISSFHWNTRNTKVFSQNIWNILKMLKIIIWCWRLLSGWLLNLFTHRSNKK